MKNYALPHIFQMKVTPYAAGELRTTRRIARLVYLRDQANSGVLFSAAAAGHGVGLNFAIVVAGLLTVPYTWQLWPVS